MIVTFTHNRDWFGNHNRSWASDEICPYNKVDDLIEIISKYFPDNISILRKVDSIVITFYDKEDNDYFRILSSDGFEI
jgi:hypothetical protein